ncbi:MAG: DciA family protein [Bifidobacteriaceae bacterium]|jgi:predicted nucleic acid-binding Zn ribbon protein|nr:DciA family protein [Bifidobacteriaceae bacterium]
MAEGPGGPGGKAPTGPAAASAASAAGAEDSRRTAERAALDRVMGSARRVRRSKAAGRQGGRDPRLAGELVEEMVAREGWSLEVTLGSLAAGWAEIVGPNVAEHCAPEAFEGGELTVRADSAAWATQIRLLEGPLISALARAVGEGLVTGVKVLGPAGVKRRPRYIKHR